MNLLLINSGDNGAFTALSSADGHYVEYASEFQKADSKKQPDNLVKCLRKLSDEHRKALEAVKAVAVTIGPGSFTGIRVGLSIAKGFAAALDIPLIPVSGFELAYLRIKKSDPQREYCIAIPANLPEYYYSVWLNGSEIKRGCAELEQLSSITAGNALIVGFFDAETKRKHSYFEYINSENLDSELDSMLRLSKERLDKGDLKNPVEVEPLYIKDFNFRKQK